MIHVAVIALPVVAPRIIETTGYELPAEPCASCLGTGFVYCYGDSGAWVVESCHEDAEGAKRCPCDGSLDRWAR